VGAHTNVKQTSLPFPQAARHITWMLLLLAMIGVAPNNIEHLGHGMNESFDPTTKRFC
jgi:hypothetical protein